METTSTIQSAKSNDQVGAFIKEIEAAYLLESARVHGLERRSSERMKLTMPVSMTVLTDQLEPSEYQYHSITRDISKLGVGLVTTNPIGPCNVMLKFQPYHGDSFSVAAKVIYCNNLGYYFQVGCEFVTVE